MALGITRATMLSEDLANRRDGPHSERFQVVTDTYKDEATERSRLGLEIIK